MPRIARQITAARLSVWFIVVSAGMMACSEASDPPTTAPPDTQNRVSGDTSDGRATDVVLSEDILATDASNQPELDIGDDVAGPVMGWRTEPSLPIEVTENAVVATESALYVLGGFVGFDTTPAVFRSLGGGAFDAAPPLPEPVHHIGVAAVGGAIWVVASESGLSFTPQPHVWRLGPDATAWDVLDDAPIARGAAGTTALGELIYSAGGVTSEGVSADIVAFEPETGTWTTGLASMPTRREHLCACALDGRVHAIGGRDNPLVNIGAHEVYDPTTNTWSVEPELPTARSGLACATLAGRIHVVGGEQLGAPTRTFDTHEVWAPDTGWVTLPPMPTSRHGLGAAVLGGRMHVVGGGIDAGFSFTSTHESFGP